MFKVILSDDTKSFLEKAIVKADAAEVEATAETGASETKGGEEETTANGGPMRGVGIPAVQATLKMSGHLITLRAFEGKLVFAAKNSTDNGYTLTAQLLLQQHLGTGERMTRLITDMQDQKICVSFECITAVNGDHGYPERTGIDVLLCTAIHSLREQEPSQPWNLIAVYEFCRGHGLPCTQTLLALDQEAAQAVFDTYEGMRHHFGPHAEQIESFFLQATQTSSLVSNVVEGFVIRSVILSTEEVRKLLELACCAPLPLLLEDEAEKQRGQGLRGLIAAHSKTGMLTASTPDATAAIAKMPGVIRFPTHKLTREGKCSVLLSKTSRDDETTGGNRVSELVGELFARPSQDAQTQLVLRTMQTMQQLKVSGSYVLYTGGGRGDEEGGAGGGGSPLSLLWVHLLFDAHQYRFHEHAKKHPECGVLYRGFVIRLWDAGQEGMKAETFLNFYPKFDNAKQDAAESIIKDLWTAHKAGGIRKFKLSYYMYLTMCARRLVDRWPKTGGGTGMDAGEAGYVPFLQSAVARFTDWKMGAMQRMPYVDRLKGWWGYLQDRSEKGKRIGPSETFLDLWMDFMANEAMWSGFSLSNLSRCVFIIDLSEDTAWATKFASCLGVELTREHASKLGAAEGEDADAAGGSKRKRKKMQASAGNFQKIFEGKAVLVNGAGANQEALTKAVKLLQVPGAGALTDTCVVVVDEAAVLALQPESMGKGSLRKWLKEAARSNCKVVNPNVTTPEALSEELKREEEHMVRPELIIPIGIPGSGKSRLSSVLASSCGMQVVASDDYGRDKSAKSKFDAALAKALTPTTSADAAQGHAKFAVVRDKNMACSQYPQVVGAGHPGRVIAIITGTTPASSRLEDIPPLTLWEVAVCMKRVLGRKAHPGGVDATLNIALRVVMNFAILLKGRFRNRAQYLANLKVICGQQRVLFYPICTEDQFDVPLPDNLQQLLEKGMSSEALKLEDLWEEQVRAELEKLDVSSVVYPLSSSEIIEQEIVENVQCLCDAGPSVVTKFHAFYQLKLDEVQVCARLEERLRPLLGAEGAAASTVETAAETAEAAAETAAAGPSVLPEYLSTQLGEKLVFVPKKPRHVTLAWVGAGSVCELSESELRALHDSIGSTSVASVSAIASDGKAAALVVSHMSGGLKSSNKQAHVTLALAEGVVPAYSNEMLTKIGTDACQVLRFDPPIELSGVVLGS